MIEHRYDLHCHSTASDGALAAADVVQRAHEHGVTVLALTDHDTTTGLAAAHAQADVLGMQLIDGVELSTTWQKQCFHVIGLGINPQHPALAQTLRDAQIIRYERAKKIAEKLEKKRIFGAFEAVSAAAGADGMITRTHFANFLFAQGIVHSQQEAFDHYLAKGKAAYISTSASAWTALEQAIQLIHSAGGIAVLAHPLRYSLKAKQLHRLLTAFKDAGGQGIEVVTGRCTAEEIKIASNYAKQFGLLASVGSDFHSPSNQWVELGRLAPLPEGVESVFSRLL